MDENRPLAGSDGGVSENIEVGDVCLIIGSCCAAANCRDAIPVGRQCRVVSFCKETTTWCQFCGHREEDIPELEVEGETYPTRDWHIIPREFLRKKGDEEERG